MAKGFLNRVGFRAASSGTGSFVVNSALTGMQTPAQAAGPAAVNGATYNYFAQSDDLTQWEYGSGVYTTGDTTLTRATIYDNSSGGTTALSFSAAPQVRMGGPLAQDMPGWTKVSEGEVSSGVEFIDITLPTAFKAFRLEISGFEFDSSNALAFVTSDDGGSSFYNDQVGFADYEVCGLLTTNGSNQNATDDAVGQIAPIFVNANVPVHAVAEIYPGGAGRNFSLICHEQTVDSDGIMAFMGATRMQAATGRQNVIRVLPFGFWDADPPTSGDEIVAGSYRLLGWPE